MVNSINNTELDLLKTAINRILETEVLEYSVSDQLPIISEMKDTNKVYSCKASVLFVDMRKSTKLPVLFNNEELVKIYRCYIRTIVQAIRYSGGAVRDFMGDGVLAIFIDDEAGTSEEKSVRSARYLTTAIEKILNPELDKKFQYRISCGIGIDTGTITISKVGMKGKEQDDDAENEYGIAWIGNCTNKACKYSGAVGNGTIFISSSTYLELSDNEEKKKWKAVSISKNENLLEGFIAQKYYLDLDEEIKPCCAEEGLSENDAEGFVRTGIVTAISEIVKKAEELGNQEKELQYKEEFIEKKYREIRGETRILEEKDRDLNLREYKFYKRVLASGHCKREYVKAMGVSFWEDNLKSAIEAGAKINITEHKVNQEVSYAMVSIYESLEMFDKAYDFLVEQATGYAWLHLLTVQNIVGKVNYYYRIKGAVSDRIKKDDLDDENMKEFIRILKWLDNL